MCGLEPERDRALRCIRLARRRAHLVSRISGQTLTTWRDGRPYHSAEKCNHETDKPHEKNSPVATEPQNSLWPLCLSGENNHGDTKSTEKAQTFRRRRT